MASSCIIFMRAYTIYLNFFFAESIQQHSPCNFEPPAHYVARNLDKRCNIINVDSNDTTIESMKNQKCQPETTSQSIDEGTTCKIKFHNPLVLDIELYDPAAKLLVATVKWLHSVASFEQITQSEQTSLLQSNWKELFIMHAAQYSFFFDEGKTETMKYN